jgi:type VI secretion system protein ImpG
LPLLIPKGSSDVFYLSDGGPVDLVDAIIHPNRPTPILAQGDTSWRLISHLSLNYLSITDDKKENGASALRELLGLYVPSGDRSVRQQITGLLSISTRPIVRRINDGVMSTPVKGLEITIDFDESYFEGTSPYLMASVLERFFRKFATLNSFTETVLTTTQRGEIKRWKPDLGLGRVI